MSILVLGLGNTIMTDDGFGVEVVTTLSSRYHFQGPVKLLDGGTLGLDLLPHLEEIESLLIIDALDMRAEPGKIFRLEGDEVPRAFASKLSVHQMGLQDLLAVAELQGHVPRNLVVWGVQPKSIEMGTELTATVAAAVEPVVANILDELQEWGIRYEGDPRM
ncbi:MAG: HyaD/HybD family hydrogenase maturation endopeptidase [Deltaproteobacteria bacterium]|nr:HyaD/HybD family hydrogenase maturation endopeptidase [Deltaproteobacteria bacterium]